MEKKERIIDKSKKNALIVILMFFIHCICFSQINGTFGGGVNVSKPLIEMEDSYLKPFIVYDINIYFMEYYQSSESRFFKGKISLDYYRLESAFYEDKAEKGFAGAWNIGYNPRIYNRFSILMAFKIGGGYFTTGGWSIVSGGEINFQTYLTRRFAVSFNYKNEIFRFYDWTLIDGFGISVRYDFGLDFSANK